jgi:hypothetical protein
MLAAADRTRCSRSTPISETPIAPPIVRTNWFRAVAAPRSPQPTEVWITISSGVSTRPSPNPTTSVAAQTQTIGWSGAGIGSMTAPATRANAPPTTSLR